MEVTVRLATAADADTLALVGAATFLASYADLVPGPDLMRHVREGHAASVYTGWLADPESGIWLAEAPLGAPLGYAVVTAPNLPTECVADGDLELRRIYMMAATQGSGAGGRLMTAVLAGAAGLGARRVTVGVHRGNDRAIGFYRHFGFRDLGARIFYVGTQRYDDLVLAREL